MAVLVLVREELAGHAIGGDRQGGLDLRGENSARRLLDRDAPGRLARGKPPGSPTLQSRASHPMRASGTTTPAGRPSNFRRRVWEPARQAAGLPTLHFHDLRHTGNTLAASTGARTKELMSRMGHASVRAALIYQHATAERDATIARALSELATGCAMDVPSLSRSANSAEVAEPPTWGFGGGDERTRTADPLRAKRGRGVRRRLLVSSQTDPPGISFVVTSVATGRTGHKTGHTRATPPKGSQLMTVIRMYRIAPARLCGDTPADN